jgi:uncharacterized membrane protein YgcG
VTGNGWDLDIGESSFTLEGPSAYAADREKVRCFTGPFGSIEEACSMTASGARVDIRSNRPLGAYEGLTVAIRFPPGVIIEPTALDTFLMFAADNGILGLPILALIVMYVLWHRRGRDPKGRGTVIPHYEPVRGLAPMEMQALRDQSIHHRATTATIIDLARRGYLKINFMENKGVFGSSQNYGFDKTREADESLSPFEREIFSGLFAGGDMVDLPELKGTFHTSVASAHDKVFASLEKKRLFGHSPKSVRTVYTTIGIVLGAFMIWTGAFFGAVAVFSIVLSALIIVAFGWHMPRKTHEGALALEEVEGFIWFLRVTEKDRLKFHNAPSLKPETFHAYLPYAIAFGVEEEWAAQFRDLSVPPPDYAAGYGSWNAMHFANSMHAMDAKAATSAYAAPSSAGSGGSGFSGGGSGGGFGGGGGGSW